MNPSRVEGLGASPLCRRGRLPGVTDWRAWHSHYDDPSSKLSRRLAVVRRLIGEALASLAPRGEVTALSLCACEGRDLLPELAALDGNACCRSVLVEKDRVLAGRARDTAASLALAGVEVVEGDAGERSTFSAYLPVDLLLLCGIFGNISRADVEATVAASPAMLRPGGFVVWTRGGPSGDRGGGAAGEPDLRPWIRSLFTRAGFGEVAFDGEPESHGVGLARFAGVSPAVDPLCAGKAPEHEPTVPERLFTFA